MKYCNNVFYETSHYIKHIPHHTFKQRAKYTLLWLSYPIVNIYQKTIVNLLYVINRVNPFQKKYPVVLVSIFKNEAKYMKEWIEYYKLIGIDHFYLYNNNSEDNYFETLKEYIEEGNVTLIEWPQIPGQLPAYKNWYENYRKDCGYAAFVDLDELICPVYDSDIKKWLNHYKKYPVIKMDWVMFGTSSQLTHDSDRLLIEQYDSCWNKRLTIGKIIYNCFYDISEFKAICMHLSTVRKFGLYILPFNDYGNVSLWGGVEFGSFGKHTIQLNHYYSRSLEGLQCKISRGDAVFKDKQYSLMNYMERENMNKRKDYTIQRFMLQLKLKMNKIGL